MNNSGSLYDAHPEFFDLDYIREQTKAGGNVADEELIRILLHPDNSQPANPNIAFDCRWVSRFIPGNPVHQYLTQTAHHGVWTHPMISPAHLRKQMAKVSGFQQNPVLFALDSLSRDDWTSHPMIDPAYISQALGRPVDVAFWRLLFVEDCPAINPHLLVDLEYVAITQNLQFHSLRDFFEAYHLAEQDYATHVLIDPAHYRNALNITEDSFRSVYHYLSQRDPLSPHLLVDHAHYRAQAFALTGDTVERPLEHYLLEGAALGLDPCPAFRTRYYVSQMDADENPLTHYIRGGSRYLQPHGILTASSLNDAWSLSDASRSTLAEALLQAQENAPNDVLDFFDADYFKMLAQQEELSHAQALDHYLRTGFGNNLPPNGLLSAPYIERQMASDLCGNDCFVYYIDRDLRRRPRILLIFDELEEDVVTRSWLQILHALRAQTGLEALVVTHQTGPLLQAFESVSHVWTLGNNEEAVDDELLDARFSHFYSLIADNPPSCAICLPQHGLKLFKIIRSRIPNCLLQFDSTLTPLDAATRNLLEQLGTKLIRDPIYCHEAIATSVEDRAHLRKEILQQAGWPEDTLIVMGAGPMTFDSGIDFFANVATVTLGSSNFARRLGFVWVGDGLRHSNTPYFFATHRLRIAGYLDRLTVCSDGPAGRYIPAADVFLHASDRTDAPLSVLEAIASNVPVFATKGRRFFERLGVVDAISWGESYDLQGGFRKLDALLEQRPNVEATNAECALSGTRLSFDAALSDLAGLPGAEDLQAVLQASVKPHDGTFHLISADALENLSVYDLSQKDMVLVFDETADTLSFELPCQTVFMASDRSVCLNQLEALGRSGFWAKLVVHGLSSLIDAEHLRPWRQRTWILHGHESELDDLYRLGLQFDEIIVRASSAQLAMTSLNSRIAGRIRVEPEAKA